MRSEVTDVIGIVKRKSVFRGRGEGLRTSCSPYTAAYETFKRTNFQAVKNNFVRCHVNFAS